MIELRVLGGLDLAADGRHGASAILTQPKRAALFTWLVLARPRGFRRRDRALGLFWPESDAGRARSALRQALHFLRRGLGADVLVSRGDEELSIDPALIRCDADAFEEAIAESRLEEARARLDARAAAAAWQMAERIEAEGDPVTAQGWARCAAALSPDDETVIRRLIEFYERNGDRTAALRAYDAFAFRLGEELEIEPSARTRALAAAVRERDPSAPTATAPAVTPGLRSATSAAGTSRTSPARTRPLR